MVAGQFRKLHLISLLTRDLAAFIYLEHSSLPSLGIPSDIYIFCENQYKNAKPLGFELMSAGHSQIPSLVL